MIGFKALYIDPAAMTVCAPRAPRPQWHRPEERRHQADLLHHGQRRRGGARTRGGASWKYGGGGSWQPGTIRTSSTTRSSSGSATAPAEPRYSPDRGVRRAHDGAGCEPARRRRGGRADAAGRCRGHVGAGGAQRRTWGIGGGKRREFARGGIWRFKGRSGRKTARVVAPRVAGADSEAVCAASRRVEFRRPATLYSCRQRGNARHDGEEQCDHSQQ